MAKDKERSVNPAQQQRKLEKAKALKKSKAELQSRRNEKLAKRNPDRIQRQIEDLKALESAGDIKPREKAILADLERDLKAVTKAKEALGEKVQARPVHPRDRDGPQSTLGKRRHDGQRKFERKEDSGSDTDDSVRNIPWPRDTPPPVPKEYRRNKNETANFGHRSYQEPAQPAVAQTTYESAPQIRDLKKEATSRFVPNVVQRKQDAIKGTSGQLLESEELDKLEKAGYVKSSEPSLIATAAKFSEYNPKNRHDLQKLKEEEEAFEKEIAMQDDMPDSANSQAAENSSVQAGAQLQPSRHVQMEEIDDEDL